MKNTYPADKSNSYSVRVIDKIVSQVSKKPVYINNYPYKFIKQVVFSVIDMIIYGFIGFIIGYQIELLIGKGGVTGLLSFLLSILGSLPIIPIPRVSQILRKRGVGREVKEREVEIVAKILKSIEHYIDKWSIPSLDFMIICSLINKLQIVINSHYSYFAYSIEILVLKPIFKVRSEFGNPRFVIWKYRRLKTRGFKEFGKYVARVFGEGLIRVPDIELKNVNNVYFGKFAHILYSYIDDKSIDKLVSDLIDLANNFDKYSSSENRR